jgi:hypothetical protein
MPTAAWSAGAAVDPADRRSSPSHYQDHGGRNKGIEGRVAADVPATTARVEEANMARLALGPIGVVVGRPGDGDVFLDAATMLEELGYATIWLAGPSISGFE